MLGNEGKVRNISECACGIYIYIFATVKWAMASPSFLSLHVC